ncbi:LysR family transcriptional regulator [Bradyrhizobium sp. WSM2254]|uniref:LysR family transcriptional regulator n=1 Tax=Bradyrhizobium sp. WSM2254 TaxID=1188263 RepID=UPI00041D59D0
MHRGCFDDLKAVGRERSFTKAAAKLGLSKRESACFERSPHDDGRLIFNSIFEVLDAAVAGFDVAFVPEDLALPHIAKGHLTRVLEDWCVPWSGYHLYSPTRSQGV